MGVPVPWGQMVSAHLQIYYCENGTSRFLMPKLTKNLNFSNKNMDKSKLFSKKKFFNKLGMLAPWKRIGQKMKNFIKFFRFLNQCTSDYYHDKFCRNRTTFIFWPQKPNLGAKNKSCPILTKFGVVIVRSTLIKKTKKNFEIFHFWANFFSWSAHARPLKKIFFAKKFIFVHIFIWDVQIFCQFWH